MNGFVSELRRRGVLGAVVAWGVAAAGALQLADIVVHNLDLPGWTLRALIWISALGLPVVAVVSWFYDLTRRGLVRTQAPAPSPATPRAQTPGSAPPGAQDIRPGTLIAGRYRVEGVLGQGGMGRVLAATDERIGRRVAVKVVTGAHDPARVARFEQEARAAGALEHPNVLAVYDMGEHEGVPFLVTELLKGHTLRTLIQRGPLPAAQARDLSLQLARGLAAAHARGVVHRDLKPENLFVTDDGRLKILDFGLARLSDDSQGPGLTQTGAIFGTPGYLSPEQARGEKVGPPADVFAAGAVMYEMVSGRRAFPGATLIEAGHAALALEPQPLPMAVRPAFEAVIVRALTKEPARRIPDGAALAQALEPIDSGLPGPVRSRKSTPLMLGLAIAAVAIAFASGLRVSRSSHREKQRAPGIPTPRVEITPPAPPPPPGIPNPKQLEQDIRKTTLRAGRLGVMAGARAMESSGQPERAEALLRRQGDPGAHLELFLLQRREGKDGTQELRDYIAKLDDDDWPAPLLRAFAGQASDADVLKAAGGDSDDTCEADYYLGLLRRSRDLLEKAASSECDEADLAQQALKELH